jgi:hypothetical protein
VFFIFITENYADVVKIAVSVAALAIGIITTTKISTFWYRMERFYNLMETIEAGVLRVVVQIIPFQLIFSNFRRK